MMKILFYLKMKSNFGVCQLRLYKNLLATEFDKVDFICRNLNLVKLTDFTGSQI